MSNRLQSVLSELARRLGLKDAPPHLVLVVAVLGVLAVVWAAARWWPGADATEPTFVSGAEAARPLDTGVPAVESAEQSAGVLVHVVGAVRRPGVYELPLGSRAIDAVDAAGGVLPDAVPSAVNLARPVTDGEQVAVPSEDDALTLPAAGATAQGSSPGPSGPQVDLNSADAVALEALPGVGPATAQKIVADREANGPYASVDDLLRVSGIGEKKLEGLREMACVK